jgi:hypothetical protein
MAGDTNEIGNETPLASGVETDPLKPLTDATSKGSAAIVAWMRMENCELIRVDANAAPSIFPQVQSQHVRFRVRAIIVNAITAGTLTLQVGTAQYPFEATARGLDVIPFPLVIERGSDVSCVGADGRIWLIGDPE